MEKIVVSSCLLGEKCRWHGKTASSPAARRLIESLGEVEVIKVCPEMLGGLPCPRPPVKRRKGRVFETCEDKARRPRVTGPERTEEFRTGAEKVLAICRENGVKRAVFCSFSPSCDRNGICGKLLAENGVEVLNTF